MEIDGSVPGGKGSAALRLRTGGVESGGTNARSGGALAGLAGGCETRGASAGGCCCTTGGGVAGSKAVGSAAIVAGAGVAVMGGGAAGTRLGSLLRDHFHAAVPAEANRSVAAASAVRR